MPVSAWAGVGTSAACDCRGDAHACLPWGRRVYDWAEAEGHEEGDTGQRGAARHVWTQGLHVTGGATDGPSLWSRFLEPSPGLSRNFLTFIMGGGRGRGGGVVILGGCFGAALGLRGSSTLQGGAPPP